MHSSSHTRASRRVGAAASARTAMRRPLIGIAVGAVLAAVAAGGIVAAPALAAPSEADLHRAASAEKDGRIALTNAVALNHVAADAELLPGTTLDDVVIADLRHDVRLLSVADEATAEQLGDFTDDVVRSTVLVQQDTAALQESLTAAKEAKAADDARKKAEAERIAAEKAAAERRAAAAALAAANTPDGARATARSMAAGRYGWGGGQFSCLSSLWQKESGWNYQAYNPSGATGIPQALPGGKMASAGADWKTNAATQISWGLDYIKRAYGTPCGAWAHSRAVNWY
ncbi:phospholipase [Microbacterium sp. ARD32]|uniref:aggregation-promoting factor C-terminal-like domain-containing protein n=1 Tax=Microbacterium sp. ARD32 TaxID=2962577 RepID=UPI0028829DE2|nr:phospholipase [Microbacterium sp. ARD32]MDT0156680.1 phospholipase [Microbacterium sp. ARD32]